MKKLLCLILTLTMLLSCFSAGMSVMGVEDRIYRPDGTGGHEDIVGKVIDPILYGRIDSDFSKSINELGYEKVNEYEKDGKVITKDTFDNFITTYADDKMFGVDYDFLYSKDKGAYFWSYCMYKLETEQHSHEQEIREAEAENRRSTCAMKGMYDACAEVLNGYVYSYDAKAMDKDIFADIVEVKVSYYNSKTGKDEVHYDYYYDLSKGDFALMRANDNNQIINTVCKVWNSDMLFETKDVANKNALAIAKFIGNLINPQFNNSVLEKEVPFTDNKKIDAYDFFKRVTELSGLDEFLQDNWCNVSTFDVKEIMYAFGVNVSENILLKVETENGVYMGARILTDMFRNFFRNPVVYVENLLQMFCKGYNYSYQRPIQALFSIRYNSILGKSRNEKATYPLLREYNGRELNDVDGFINFIADCIYVEKIDTAMEELAEINVAIKNIDEDIAKAEKEYKESATLANKRKLESLKEERDALKAQIEPASRNIENLKTDKFAFAPLPVNRIATASDADELHLYMLCYMDINRIYEGNSEKIDAFITKIIKGISACETADLTEIVLRSLFAGDLTLVEVIAIHLTALTASTITSFPDNFSSSIKNAIASLIQKFLDAMESFMGLLFGWTDGLFDKEEEAAK